MGNCAPKPRKATPGFDPYVGSPEPPPTPPPTKKAAVRLHGPAGSSATSTIRVALLYKSAAVQFFPSREGPLLEHAGESVAGTPEAILQYIDAKLPGPAILGKGLVPAQPGMALAAALQHRSMERHLERIARWAEGLAAEEVGGVEGKDRRRCRAETRRLRRSYAQLAEMMLEHAQMEERLVFPALESADRGWCRAATEEHARELPIINGIKEDIKSVVVLDPGTPAHREALLHLSLRLRSLQEQCREHFAEEERELLTLLEATERVGGRGRAERAVEQLVESMEGTHSHLFTYLAAGLLPPEVMQYLDVVCRCRDQRRVAGMLRSLEARLEAAGTPATTSLSSLFKVTQQ
ncbi:hypothetical protein Taro_005379 [Colocasia esculenta]|uniref:Hemerythrin-like domain-containing protein n=1 Tax=Colocasia esculenta TaxID=4460 RepID=A0A843TUE9_COLES|nr:hypothetical protein [Colocasia esculenta]